MLGYRNTLFACFSGILFSCTPQGVDLSIKQNATPTVGDDSTQSNSQSDSTQTINKNISANNSSEQTITADSGPLQGTELKFPPGSVAVDTQVAVSEGGNLATSEFFAELALDGASQAEGSSTSVIVDSNNQADPTGVISVTIPMPQSGASLTQSADSKALVVLFKLYIKSRNTFKNGIIPLSELQLNDGKNTVSFPSSYFGQFQAIYLRGVEITTRIEKPSLSGFVKKEAIESQPVGTKDETAVEVAKEDVDEVVIPVRPTVEIKSDMKSPTNRASYDVDVMFSQPVFGLSSTGFVLSGASVLGLTGSGNTYQLRVAPLVKGKISITLPENIARNADGIGNMLGEFFFEFDNQAPSLSILGPGTNFFAKAGQAFSINGECGEVGSPVSISIDSVVVANADCINTGFDVNYSFSGTIFGVKTISVSHGDLAGNTTTATKGIRFIESLTVSARNSVAQNWTSQFRISTPSQACDGTESASAMEVCAFGGPLRKVEVLGRSDCLGLTMTDALAAFDWECQVRSPGVAFSSKLKPGIRLGDLLEPDPAPPYVRWKANMVTVNDNGVLIGSSDPAAVWWGDVLNRLSTDNQEYNLTDSGTINVVHSTNLQVDTINLNANNQALVVLDGVKVFGGSNLNNCATTGEITAPTGRCIVAAGTQHGLWIEGAFDSTSPGYATYTHSILLASVKSSRLQHVLATKSAAYGLYLINTRNLQMIDVATQSNFSEGIKLSTANYIQIQNFSSANNSINGLALYYSNDVSIVGLKAFSNGNSGLVAQNSSRVTVSDFLLTNNNGDGLALTSSTNNVFSMGTVVNNKVNGINFGSGSSGNVLNSVAILGPGSSGYGLLNNAATTSIFSNIAIGYYTSAMSISGSSTFSNNLLLKSGQSCLLSGTTNLASLCASGSGFTLQSSADMASMFGVPTNQHVLDETINWNPPGRTLTLGTSSLTPDYLSLAGKGRCTTLGETYCALYDWTMVANYSGELKEIGGHFPPPPTTAPAVCPSSVSMHVAGGGRTFLLYALELVDGIGNDDGLCETNEHCVFAPNIGEYQGHGGFLSHQCSYDNASVPGVKLYGFAQNGI